MQLSRRIRGLYTDQVHIRSSHGSLKNLYVLLIQTQLHHQQDFRPHQCRAPYLPVFLPSPTCRLYLHRLDPQLFRSSPRQALNEAIPNIHVSFLSRAVGLPGMLYPVKQWPGARCSLGLKVIHLMSATLYL